MANFAELSVFNKLLLQKMERMEKEHRKIIEEMNIKLVSRGDAIDWDEYSECRNCGLCCEIGVEGEGCDNGCYYCDGCKHDGVMYNCFDCDKMICLECNEFKCLLSCKECYLLGQYPNVESDVFENYDECVDELNIEFLPTGQ